MISPVWVVGVCTVKVENDEIGAVGKVMGRAKSKVCRVGTTESAICEF